MLDPEDPFLNQNQSYNHRKNDIFNYNENILYNQNEEQYLMNSNEDCNLYPNEEENSYNPYSESEEKEKKGLSDSFKSKDINNEEKNPEKLDYVNALEVSEAKNEVLLLENGTFITTSNALQKEVLNKYLRSTEVKEEETVGIQLSKRKRKRRTKKEVLKEKMNKKTEPKIIKKTGRRKKKGKDNLKDDAKHSKDAFDNIVKLINTFIIHSVRIWINKSFIDKNYNFINKNKKKIKEFIKKISPKIISNNTKKNIRLEILDKTLKEIFSSNPLSKKYKKFSKNYNNNLIEIIYQKDEQPLVKFILDLSFLECLNYFNGETTDEKMTNLIKKKYNFDDLKIKEFLSNFEKIDILYDKLYKKLKEENESDEDIKTYFTKIKFVSLNYKKYFDNIFERGENKKTKATESKNN